MCVTFFTLDCFDIRKKSKKSVICSHISHFIAETFVDFPRINYNFI